MRLIPATLLAVTATIGPITAQNSAGEKATQVDCSAYQRQTDGRWIVTRTNKITFGNDASSEIEPESTDPELVQLGCPSACAQKPISRAISI